jgi:carbonic anhydrase
MGLGVEMPRPSADEARRRLTEGNQRFVRREVRREPFRPKTVVALSSAQRPYATIYGVSDSRVSPERVFDTGVGELCDSLARCRDAAEEDGASCH